MKTEMRLSARHSSSPSMIGMEKRPKASLVISPTVKVWPRCRLCARSFGRKPSSLATAITLARVSGFRLPLLFSAFETVPMLTFAARATSRMVSGARGVRFGPVGAAAVAASPRSVRHHFTTPLRKPDT